jgi:glycosyltransferase involved in cell wall biosynthesis
MIKVTALTGSKYDPSSRFRVRQFIKPLRSLGVDVSEYWPLISRYKIEPLPWVVAALRLPGLAASRLSDITWLGRELISGKSSLEHLAGKKRLFDVDDAIWVPYEDDFSAEIVKRCDGVIAGNRFLAEHYEKLGARVWLVPTSIDTELWRPAKASTDTKWTIGWSGSGSNLPFLYTIEDVLADFLAQHLDSRLLIVSDQRPQFERLPPASWEFVAWSMTNEVALVQQMNAGLMPLADSELARGKCGFKMLTYMACEIPALVSPVGVNSEILQRAEVGFGARTQDEWFAALLKLHADRELGVRMGAAGRKVVEEHYSVANSAKLLADIFRSVAAG